MKLTGRAATRPPRALRSCCCRSATPSAQGVTTGSITGTVTDRPESARPGRQRPRGARALGNALRGHDPRGRPLLAPRHARRRALHRHRDAHRLPAADREGRDRQPRRRERPRCSPWARPPSPRRSRSPPQSSEVFSSARTGAATAVSRDVIQNLPTDPRPHQRLRPPEPAVLGGPFGGSFVGQDNRLNNITVDGSYFNNSFGLGGQPGDRTGVTPISTAAVEEIQINVAPYDVRQGHFVGAGVNMVTRSGTNQFRGLGLLLVARQRPRRHRGQGPDLQPRHVRRQPLRRLALRPDRQGQALLLRAATRTTSTPRPGTTFRANTGGETVGGNVTRVLASDLDALSSYLNSNFKYDTGAYQDYPFETPAKRYLAKLDYNLNDRNKVSVRYLQLDSETPVAALELELARPRHPAHQHDRPQLRELQLRDPREHQVGRRRVELDPQQQHGQLADRGLHHQRREPPADGRASSPSSTSSTPARSTPRSASSPSRPNNELRYHTFQVQDNFTWNRGNHTFTFGGTVEKYHSDNVFYPGAQSVYVYNSLADFYTDANDYLANPNRTTSPVTSRSSRCAGTTSRGRRSRCSRSTSGTGASTPRTSGRPPATSR